MENYEMENYEFWAKIPKSIRELVDEKNTPRDSLFYRYKDKKEVGEQIFKELIKRFIAPKDMEEHGTRMGFYMDDSSKEIGLLSQSQGLQSLLLLTSAFGLDFDEIYDGTKSSKENGEKVDLTIRMIMDLVINDIISRLTDNDGAPLNERKYVFDASPYASEAFDTDYAYIDCITWVIPTFLLVLRYHVDIGEICRYEREMISIIKSGLHYLNEAYITPTKENNKQLTCGWNFTKDCEEPSLYFTFAVTECFVDLFNTFELYLKDVEALRDKRDHGLPLDAETKERIESEKKLYEETLAEKSFDSIQYTKGEAAFFGDDKYNELKRLYMLINDGNVGFKDSPYGELESKCKEVAKTVWGLVKDKFADYFYYNDLHATITEEDLRMSTTNDALFNSVYIINILLDTGIDEDINKEIRSAENQLKDAINPEDGTSRLSDEERQSLEKDIADKTRDYNNLLETCQFALQKAFRAYENLKNESREYIVDQFLVGFNEKLVKLESKVRELRKLRIRVFSLLPLFIKTNSVISEYLVKYPQNSMKKYLGYIMDNRYIERSKNLSHWIWEQDGYFSASNYYYISALGEFYAYYETYERDFIDDESRVQGIREAYKEELEKNNGDIGKLRSELKRKEKDSERDLAKKEAEIVALREERDAIKTPIEDAVNEVITKQVTEMFAPMLTGFIRDAATSLTAEYLDQTAPKPEYIDFKKAIIDLILSFLAKEISEQIEWYKPSAGTAAELDQKEKYAQLSKEICDDMTDLLNENIGGISRFPAKVSALNKLIKNNPIA